MLFFLHYQNFQIIGGDATKLLRGGLGVRTPFVANVTSYFAKLRIKMRYCCWKNAKITNAEGSTSRFPPPQLKNPGYATVPHHPRIGTPTSAWIKILSRIYFIS